MKIQESKTVLALSRSSPGAGSVHIHRGTLSDEDMREQDVLIRKKYDDIRCKSYSIMTRKLLVLPSWDQSLQEPIKLHGVQLGNRILFTGNKHSFQQREAWRVEEFSMDCARCCTFQQVQNHKACDPRALCALFINQNADVSRWIHLITPKNSNRVSISLSQLKERNYEERESGNLSNIPYKL